MERIPDPDVEIITGVAIRFPDPGPLRVPSLVDCKDLFFRYEFSTKSASHRASEDKKLPDIRPWLLQNVNVRIDKDSRIGCLGANGSGKSTLIKIILNELKPVTGMVTTNSTMRTSLFAQHHLNSLNLSFTPLQQLQELYPGSKETDCRSLLARYGLPSEQATMQIGDLSGGQKSRLAFAIITWREPHLLVLDEPTNHLDMETIDDLINAVAEYKGAVLAVSHDQFFFIAHHENLLGH